MENWTSELCIQIGYAHVLCALQMQILIEMKKKKHYLSRRIHAYRTKIASEVQRLIRYNFIRWEWKQRVCVWNSYFAAICSSDALGGIELNLAYEKLLFQNELY